ncbi:hypothetical protein C8Q69DRAFT_474384 [Paecilomyces variotii]|uniref:Uncharacterized protein n=1 Tax=Byssochlamys spectabilis TaxID=264951 RepID=A0A443HP98_BYSSP|nr:hypothetical protein C8Q69DRAFT_474384 [Paecilomyces variotii]RWQ93658.1 hypothetical protein C8Q69DRAFT_474384 [Paecilomyces variotii]
MLFSSIVSRLINLLLSLSSYISYTANSFSPFPLFFISSPYSITSFPTLKLQETFNATPTTKMSYPILGTGHLCKRQLLVNNLTLNKI